MSVIQPGQSTRFVCRSYMAAVLVPEPPLVDWVADIEQRIKGAGAFLAGSPVVLDLSAVKLSQSAIAHLVAELDHRGVRVMGLENTDPATAGAGLPPLVRASRGVRRQRSMQSIHRKRSLRRNRGRNPPRFFWTSRYARGSRSSFRTAM